MAVPFMAILGILGGIGKHILEVPLIHRGVENYLDGTPTKWDNLLWRMLELACNIASPDSEVKAAVVANVVDKVQAQYTEVKARVANGAPEHEAFEAVTGRTIQELLGNG